MKRIALIGMAALLFSACASGGLTTREKGTLGGAALGAATGAIIGSATGKAGTGALIGAGLGGLTGAVIGDQLQAVQQQGEHAGPVAATPPPSPPTPQPQAAAVAVPGTYTGDPTRGEFVNATRWRVSVFINPSDPARPESAQYQYTLNPQQSAGANLDIGQHRIIAQAYVDTQFGPRLAGKYDRTIRIDPRSTGWSIRFTEGDFQ